MTGGRTSCSAPAPPAVPSPTPSSTRARRVRMVNRSGASVIAGVETIGGDATDPDFARDVAADADTVYFCLNAPNYHRWAEEFPPLQHAVLGAARSADAKLVVLENLYMYGPSDGPLRETTPVNPTSAKSRTRAEMSAELLDAHGRGEVSVVIGRASDFVGPGVRDSAFGEFVFGPALAGKRAQIDGTTRHPAHLQLRPRRRAQPRAPRLPRGRLRPGVAPPEPADAHDPPGHHRRVRRGRDRPRKASRRSSGRCCEPSGCSTATSGELLHTYYQFAAPFVVDDSAFRDAFGGRTTSWDEIVDQHRRLVPRAAPPSTTQSNGLAEAPTEKVTS